MTSLQAVLPGDASVAAQPGVTGPAIGTLRAIALRPGVGRAPVAVPQAMAATGLGLDGDCHADALSPRQLLLAGTPAYVRHALAPHALRENLLLDVETANLASGTLLRIGPEAVVVLTFHCEACAYLDVRQPGIARAIGRQRGVLARVLRGGALRVGDAMVPLPGAERAPPDTWADDWRERVAAILARVPPGMVVEYRQLARLAGVQSVYCRTFPRLARQLGFAHAAVATGARPELLRWQGEALFAALGP